MVVTNRADFNTGEGHRDLTETGDKTEAGQMLEAVVVVCVCELEKRG